MIKKIGKGIVILLGIVFLILLIIPLAFKGKINTIAKQQINKNINATVSFEDLSLSLLRSFPSMSIDLQNLVVVNKAPFLGDTLVKARHTYVNVSLMSLLGDVPKINSVTLADVFADIKVNKQNVANYDITLPSAPKKENVNTTETTPFSLEIDAYSLKNINLKYKDEASNMSTTVVNFNHNGSGDFSNDTFDLDTHTNVDAITFKMDEVTYLKEVHLKYDATIGVNYKNDLHLSFKNNVAHINDLNLSFDGTFAMLKEAYNMDFTLESKNSEFKSLLSLVPNAYTADFKEVKTTGALDVHGTVKGKYYGENNIPSLDVVVRTNNASVQYPNVPQKIENIYIDTHITNKTGVIDDTKVAIKNFSFKIANDPFTARATLTKPISNLTVDAAIKGKLNLANLKNASHLSGSEMNLKGIVKADVEAAFDMNSIDKKQFDRIKSKGNVSIEEVLFDSDFTPNPVFIKKAALLFNLKNATLKETSITSGNSDIQLKGSLDNIYGYVFSDGLLKGNLEVTSKLFKVADFYVADTTAVATQVNDTINSTTEQFKIMSNVEFLGTVAAKKILYDNIEMTNFFGTSEVKNQKITFKNATANVFKGAIDIDGYADTKPNPTVYNFDMKLKQVDIASAFNGLDMLKKITPIVGAFHGRFDSEFDVSGALGNDFMPDLSKLSGEALANLQVDRLDTSKNKFLSLADSKMSFLNLSKTDLKDLKTKITFKDSKVNIAPFALNIKGIPVTVEGSHGFDNKMDYSLKLDVPARFLGSKAQDILSKLSNTNQGNLRVPLNVKVGGTVTQPTVVPNIKEAIAAVTSKVIAEQKDKVKNKVKQEATKKIKDLLGIEKVSPKEDGSKTSPKEEVKQAGKKILRGLFGK